MFWIWAHPKKLWVKLKGTKVDRSISDYVTPKELGGHIWPLQQFLGGPWSWDHCQIQQGKVQGGCTIIVHVVPTNCCV